MTSQFGPYEKNNNDSIWKNINIGQKKSYPRYLRGPLALVYNLEQQAGGTPSEAKRTESTPPPPVNRTNHQSGSGATASGGSARAGARAPMDLPPLSHQALFAAVRSADAAAVRALLADAEASGTSLAALAAAQTDAGETALYVAAEAGSEELVRILLPLYDLEDASVRSRLDLDAFHVAAKQGHTGEIAPLSPSGPYG